jgi:hypothetical protein
LNYYTYTGNDPVDFNDPLGLVTCGNLPVQGGSTLSSFYNTTSDTGKLTEFVWAEGGTYAANGDSDTMTTAQEFIAQAVEDRLAIANGSAMVQGADGKIYWGAGGNGFFSASVLGYGSVGTTMSQEIVRADGGVGEVNSSGVLNDTSGITNTLNTDLGDPTRALPGRVPVTLANRSVYYVTPECDRAITAMQATNLIVGGGTVNYAGVFVTSWKQTGNSNPDPTHLYTLGTAGATTFYGFQSAWTVQYPWPRSSLPHPPHKPPF